MSGKTPAPVPATRIDPYKNFRFRILMDGKPVAGVSKVSSLKRTTALTLATGTATAPRKLPARTKFETITLERGVTNDAGFASWAQSAANGSTKGSAKASGTTQRRDFVLEVLSESGDVTGIYELRQCRVSAFQALPDLDSKANALAIQHLKLEVSDLEQVKGAPATAAPTSPSS